MTSPSVLVSGNLTIDELVSNHRLTLSPGGSAMFASCASRYLGSKVGILGNVGADYSPTILEKIAMMGVDVSFLRKTPTPSARFRIARFNGRRKLNLIEPGESLDVPRNLSRFEGIHVGPVFNEISMDVVDILRKKCDILSADLQGFIRKSSPSGLVHPIPRNLNVLFRSCDIVQSSLEEARSQTRLRSPKGILGRLVKFNVKHAILTMAEKGSWLGSRRGGIFFVPAYSDPYVTDSTGAGDVFAGSWISTFLSTRDAVWSSAVGSAFASLASRRTGLSKFRFSKRELLRRAIWVYNHTIIG